MNRLFSDKELKLLIVPLLIEQVLAITVGYHMQGRPPYRESRWGI